MVSASISAIALLGLSSIKATIPAGTAVPLVLMTQLSSGGADVGKAVPFMVSEDVKGADGTVLIKQGTLASGKVVSSKGLGLLSPPGTHARLNVKLEQTWSADGKVVPLCAEIKKTGDPFEFTRDNTGKPASIPGLDKLWADAQMKSLLTQATAELGESQAASWSKDPAKRQALVDAMQEMKLGKASDAIKADAMADLYTVMRTMRQGTAFSHPVAALTAQAALEMARLTDSVQSRVAGALKRRNITAHIGTPVTAYVAKDVS